MFIIYKLPTSYSAYPCKQATTYSYITNYNNSQQLSVKKTADEYVPWPIDRPTRLRPTCLYEGGLRPPSYRLTPTANSASPHTHTHRRVADVLSSLPLPPVYILASANSRGRLATSLHPLVSVSDSDSTSRRVTVAPGPGPWAKQTRTLSIVNIQRSSISWNRHNWYPENSAEPDTGPGRLSWTHLQHREDSVEPTTITEPTTGTGRTQLNPPPAPGGLSWTHHHHWTHHRHRENSAEPTSSTGRTQLNPPPSLNPPPAPGELSWTHLQHREDSVEPTTITEPTTGTGRTQLNPPPAPGGRGLHGADFQPLFQLTPESWIQIHSTPNSKLNVTSIPIHFKVRTVFTCVVLKH